jgi:hypothetical protein
MRIFSDMDEVVSMYFKRKQDDWLASQMKAIKSKTTQPVTTKADLRKVIVPSAVPPPPQTPPPAPKPLPLFQGQGKGTWPGRQSVATKAPRSQALTDTLGKKRKEVPEDDIFEEVTGPVSKRPRIPKKKGKL